MTSEEWIDLGNQYEMNNYGRLPVMMVKGKGTRLWDSSGREYLDFLAGIGVNNLGHCHEKVVAAIQRQAGTLIHCSNIYWIKEQIQLSEKLADYSGMAKTFFCNSGAEANEAAIKLARKYAKQHGNEGRYEIVTMVNSFHGRTLGALKATGQEKMQEDFTPLPKGFKYAEYNDIDSLKKTVTDKTCAVMLEVVQGEGGVIPAQLEYLKSVREFCSQQDLLLIFDEVQCGMGRTGDFFAYQTFGVQPDVVTAAKALGGGVPIGVVMASEQASVFVPGDHGSTFGGNPLVTAAANAFLEVLTEEGFLKKVRETGEYFQGQLKKIKEEFEFIEEVRGLGLMVGCLLKMPGSDIVRGCFEDGLLINCTQGNVLRFLPPLNVTRAEIDQGIEILRKNLKKVGE